MFRYTLIDLGHYWSKISKIHVILKSITILLFEELFQYQILNMQPNKFAFLKLEAEFCEFKPCRQNRQKPVPIERQLKSLNVEYNFKWTRFKFFKFGL